MNAAERLIVLAAVADLSWRAAWAFLRADETLRRAPWPVRRSTPEPVRLRLVRGGRVYDWESDGELVSASGGSRSVLEGDK